MIIDLFAGPGGWDWGIRSVTSTRVIGYEHDSDVVATRAANGFKTTWVDLGDYPPEAAMADTPIRKVTGLVASPPCPDFSIAGLKAGRDGKTGWLTDVVPDWVAAFQPEWIACEQVPVVEELWREHAAIYKRLGYRTWVGILNAADYGVPQHRKRAVLLARKGTWRPPLTPPPPTHGSPDESVTDLFGWHRWDWTPAEVAFPAAAPGDRLGFARRADDKGAATPDGRYRARDLRELSKPAFTLTEKARSWKLYSVDGSEPRQITVAEAAALQGFPPTAVFTGTRTSQFRQVANAVPPPLAAVLVDHISEESIAW